MCLCSATNIYTVTHTYTRLTHVTLSVIGATVTYVHDSHTEMHTIAFSSPIVHLCMSAALQVMSMRPLTAVNAVGVPVSVCVSVCGCVCVFMYSACLLWPLCCPVLTCFVFDVPTRQHTSEHE